MGVNGADYVGREKTRMMRFPMVAASYETPVQTRVLGQSLRETECRVPGFLTMVSSKTDTWQRTPH